MGDPVDRCIMRRLPAIMTSYLFWATVLCYAASLAGYVVYLVTEHRGYGGAATLLLVAGLICHYGALLERSRLLHAVPYDDLYGSLSLFAWLLGVTYLGLERLHRQRSVGAFILPVVLIVFMIAHLGRPIPATTPLRRGPLLALHITLNVLGYSAFALSFVLSVIYLVENSLLRSHRLGKIVWRFPALEVAGTHEPQQRDCRAGFAGVRHRLRAALVSPHLWPILECGSEGSDHLVILAVYAGYLWLGRTRRLAGSAGLRILRNQFFLCAVQL